MPRLTAFVAPPEVRGGEGEEHEERIPPGKAEDAPTHATDTRDGNRGKPGPTEREVEKPKLGVSKQQLEELNSRRRFRWPDGSLRAEKPPAKRSVYLARREWQDIVDYCRRTGGCPMCTEGECLLHGVGVSQDQHEKYLREIGVWNQPLKELEEKVYLEEIAQT